MADDLLDLHSGANAASGPEIPGVKPKTPLRKDELEKIAKQLKRKLLKASITAKQLFLPANTRAGSGVPPKLSPLKSYMLKRQLLASLPGTLLLSSPNLYLPNGKSPTQMRVPAAVFLSLSPLKNVAGDTELPDLPTKKRNEPQMILQAVAPPNTPPKALAAGLKPLAQLPGGPGLENPHKTPTLSKKQLHLAGPSANVLLKTPTQTRGNGNYNDDEGADLLMYLATLPSPAKPFFLNTPRTASTSAPTSAHKHSLLGLFIAPPPLTPKRPHASAVGLTRTPQNRLTPSINLFNGTINGTNAAGLPSSGLTLTPAGFNMNDYVNFFTPSPGGAGIQHHGNGSLGMLNNKNFLKTPDFNTIMNAHAASAAAANGSAKPQTVDGKMINFDKVGLFNSTASDASKE